MAKIFISHSTKNKEIIKCFVDFLQVGMGISREGIFCTSYPNTLPTGEEFIRKIRQELTDCEAVIFIITEQYLKSPFCLAELGAAWGLGKKIYPLLLVDIEQIENTPLKGIQALFLDRKKDISILYDEFCTGKIILNPCTGEFMDRLPEFLSRLKALDKGDLLLEPAADGYYHTEITAVRSQMPPEYQCYKIKGHVEAWKAENAAKTDWIFFRTGVYEELKVGDKVRFKISKTRVRDWNDIGRARDIYPADLEVVV